MEIIIKEDYDQICEEAVKIIHRAWKKKNDLVLGLPTGRTPLGVYKRLIQLYQKEEIDFSSVVTFSLDEYLGLKENHPQRFISAHKPQERKYLLLERKSRRYR
jgi:glucosamine-6-phosphate deaminase